VQKEKRERFRRHAEIGDMGQVCDPEVAAVFEGV
jgi:hypothetical protein